MFPVFRYQEVIRVCALQYDLSLYDSGDETIVADRGLNLSKGQQARVNLARAIYRNSDIYLLDDSLTALDPQVQDYIFEECIKQFLKDKICVLVTQTAHHVPQANSVVLMEDGKVKSCGQPNEEILKVLSEVVVKDDDLDKEIITKEEHKVELEENCLEDIPLKEEYKVGKSTVYGEIKKQGQVDYAIYKKYFAFGGGIIVLLAIGVLFGLSQVTDSYSSSLLSQW